MGLRTPIGNITVTVVAADPLTRAGAHSLLRHIPGLAVVEPGAPHGAGVAVVLTERLDEAALADLRRLARSPGLRVVLVTDRLREPELLNVLEYGVRTVLWRSEVTARELERAVRAAAGGESRLPTDLLGQLMSNVSRARRATGDTLAQVVSVAGFGAREIDVLKMLAEGMTTSEIAKKLSYSERTIKNVIAALLSRMRLRNRAHAVAFALREGYI